MRSVRAVLVSLLLPLAASAATPTTVALDLSSLDETSFAALDGVAFATQPFTYAATAVEEMITTARDDDGTVEPFFLQILCSHVEWQVGRRQSAGGQNAAIDVDGSYLGGKEGVKALTGKFYLGALDRIPDAAMKRHARRMCEEGLLTSGGRRRSALKEDLEQQFGVNAGVLGALEEGRLLRKEPRHGSFYYEISHDRLAVAVQENRRWRVPRELKITIAAFAILLGVGVVAMWGWARFEANKRRQADELATVFNHVLDGDLNASRRKWDAAQRSFGMALESWKQRAGNDQANLRWQRELAVTHERLGNVHFKLDNPIQAAEEYQTARTIWEILLRKITGTAMTPAMRAWNTMLADPGSR